MNTWTRKNALWLLLYVVLYVIATVIVCVLGSVHAALFVCYQITAALIVTGVAGKAFDRIKAPGVAACLGLGMILTFFAIGDANLWHCIPCQLYICHPSHIASRIKAIALQSQEHISRHTNTRHRNFLPNRSYA